MDGQLPELAVDHEPEDETEDADDEAGDQEGRSAHVTETHHPEVRDSQAGLAAGLRHGRAFPSLGHGRRRDRRGEQGEED